MAYKCTDLRCPYGPEWDEGNDVTRNADGTVMEHLRADSYSQTPSFKDPSISGFYGLCLNCIDDRELDRQFAAVECYY